MAAEVTVNVLGGLGRRADAMGELRWTNCWRSHFTGGAWVIVGELRRHVHARNGTRPREGPK